MTNRVLIILISFLISFSLTCRCPRKQANSTEIIKDSTFVASEVKIEGKIYGTPFVVKSIIFLPYNFTYDGNLNRLNCPTDYRYPTIEEYSKIISELGADALSVFKDPAKFGLVEKMHLLTSTKTFPEVTAGADSKKYEVVSIIENAVKIQSLSIPTNQEKFIVKCVQNKVVSLSYLSPVFESKEIELKVQINYQNVQWIINDDSTLINELVKKVTFPKSGCNIVQFWGLDLSDDVVYGCEIIHSLPLMGNNNDYVFEVGKIITIETGIKVTLVNGLFFSPSAFPIAIKDNGGFYVMIINPQISGIHVLDYSADYKLIANVHLGLKGRVFDVTATPWGFVFFLDEDNHRAVLYGFYANYQMKFKTVVMNNGEGPAKVKEQITFYQANTVPYFGLNGTYKPNNAKLRYVRGRIAMIHAHYANFKAGTAEVEGHTGDSVYSFDDNGQDAKIGWSWGASHSVIQSMVCENYICHLASLGDAFPMNIVGAVIDVSKISSYVDPILKYQTGFFGNKKSLSKEEIPGDAIGGSCGRLGGTVTNGEVVVTIYSVKPCNAKPHYTRNQIGFLSYKASSTSFEDLKEIPILEGEISNDIVNLRIGKWGNKILIFIITTEKSVGMDMNPRSYATGMRTFYMVVDFNGTVIQEYIPAPKSLMPYTEDPLFQKNGDLVWTSEEKGKLLISYLEAKY